MDRSEIIDLLKSKSHHHIHYYLEDMIDQLIAADVKITIQDTPQVSLDDGIGCSGFFNSEPLEFAVAVGKPHEEWLKIFIHEFAHFEQWRDDAVLFDKRSTDIGQLFAWVNGDIELDEPHLLQCRDSAIEIEYDCEVRVLAKIRHYALESIINPQAYTRMANAYFNFYHYVVAERVWYKPGHEPYVIDEVWNHFPAELVKLDGMDDELRALYSRCV